jgi:hypothetical protein
VFVDSTKRVYVGVIVISREVLVSFVEYHPCGSKFDWESAHPSYSIVFATKAAACHLSSIRRMSEVCSRRLNWPGLVFPMAGEE